MELYYNIVKNVYKTYTKRINSVYKFLIGSCWARIAPTPFLLASVYKIKGLAKSGCLRIGASVKRFLSSFHALSISSVQQFLNLLEVISLSGLAICPNPWIYFLKKPTAPKNPLNFEIVVGRSRASIAVTLPRSGIVPSAEIRCPNNFISDLANSHFSTLIFNPAHFN